MGKQYLLGLATLELRMVASKNFMNQCNKRPNQPWAFSGLQHVGSAIADAWTFVR